MKLGQPAKHGSGESGRFSVATLLQPTAAMFGQNNVNIKRKQKHNEVLHYDEVCGKRCSDGGRTWIELKIHKDTHEPSTSLIKYLYKDRPLCEYRPFIPNYYSL